MEKIIYPWPTDLFFSGDLAVYIFFTLSGFVISINFFKKQDIPNKMFFRRYIRLMPAAAATIFLSYLILKFGFMYNKQAYAISGSWWLNLNWESVSVSFKNMLWMALYGTWFSPIAPQAQFNSNLGTLFVEIIASFLVYSFLIFIKRINMTLVFRTIFYIAMIFISIMLTHKSFDFAVFFCGLMFADFFVNCKTFYLWVHRFRFFILIVALYFASVNISNLGSKFYSPINFGFRYIGIHPLSGPWAIAAILIFFISMTFDRVKNFLVTPFIQFLGHYSYPLYLVHTVLIGSVSCFVVVILVKHGISYNVAVLSAFVVTSVVVFLAAHLLSKIDALAIKISHLC